MLNDVFKYYENTKDGTVLRMVGPFKIINKTRLKHNTLKGYEEVEYLSKVSHYDCFSCHNALYPKGEMTITKYTTIIPDVSRYIETPNYGKKAIYVCPMCGCWNYKINTRKK